MTKDITANAIYYNLVDRKLEDPLNGIEDLRRGIVVTPLKNEPLKKDFFRTFRIFKTSAELSLKISDYIEDYLRENKHSIKVYY
jgi:tRNA nucleotidyltransferase/poly(A) polymerase